MGRQGKLQLEPEVKIAQHQQSSPWQVGLHSQSAPAEQVRDEETETPWFKKLPGQSQHFCPALPHGLFSSGLVDGLLYCAPSGADDLPPSEWPLCSLPTTGGCGQSRAGLLSPLGCPGWGWSRELLAMAGAGGSQARTAGQRWERGLWEREKWEKCSGK